MPRKKKPKPFRAVTAVKAAARLAVGTPKATRRDKDVTKSAAKKQKHRTTLSQLLQEKDYTEDR